MSDELSLELRFRSDWHVGEGAGARGHVDAIVRRHPVDDVPYVPAKTLTGVLRDGCERVVYGLDGGDAGGPWHALLREVFGGNQEDEVDPSARVARLSIGPARLGEPLRKAFQDTPEMREALVFLKPGVKLDEHGVAESQMLRFEEVVLAGAELTAPVALQISAERRECALALIAAGARAVERLGGKRRRGTGRCELALSGGLREDRLIAALQRVPDTTPHPDNDQPEMLLDRSERTAGHAWRVIALDLELQSPVIVPAETLGNVVTTQDHIPGSLLLPALHGWLRALLGDAITPAIASGAVQVRNAYPSEKGGRLLPVPASLFRLKEGEECTNHLVNEPQDKRQRKQFRAGFVSTDALPLDRKSGVVEVDTTATTHATIEDERQRPTTKVGGVYTYLAMRPGQRLVAELWIDETLLDPHREFAAWLKDAPKTLRIGRAKKDDYGRVALACRETSPHEPPTAMDGLTVWLASPLLLRDDALAPVMDAAGLGKALGAALGVGLTLRTVNGQHCAYLRPWRDDGWNNAWQMRRATRFGIAPGSCLAFQVSGPLAEDALKRVEACGLGERRGEGYGELVFNRPLLSAQQVSRRALAIDAPGKAEIGELRESAFSRAVQRRAARLAIRRKALEIDEQFRSEIGWQPGRMPLPPNTQLGALRALMESLTDAAGLRRISAWLKAVEENEKRRDKWPKKTKELLARHSDENDSNAIWKSLQMDNGPTPLPGHDRASLAGKMRIEAIKSLWLTAISRQLNENNRAQGRLQAREETKHGA